MQFLESNLLIFDFLQWWKKHDLIGPLLLKQSHLCTPSSAAEGVFLLQNYHFAHQQNSSLVASLKLQSWLNGSIMGNCMSIIGKIPGIAGIA